MKLSFAGLLMAVAARCAEPGAADQTAMQDALRRYMQAVNDCDAKAAGAAITKDFSPSGVGMGVAFNARLRPGAAVCGPDRVALEMTAQARVLRSVTDDVTIADGFFRTMGLPGGDKSGRLYLTFVRRDGKWQVMGLKFHALPSEAPIVVVVPAAAHDPAGADGWVTLFDGGSTAAFIEAGGGAFPPTWKVEGGVLKSIPAKQGRGLQTRDTYQSFELRFEWMATAKGNSGIKYHLFYLLNGPQGSDAAGYEYQLADDAGDPGAVKYPVERSGGLYNQLAPVGAVLKPLGEFNQSAIVVRGRHTEHWLNGVKVLDYEAESGPPEGPLVIQHHTTEMGFKNIRVRRLN